MASKVKRIDWWDAFREEREMVTESSFTGMMMYDPFFWKLKYRPIRGRISIIVGGVR